MQLSFEAGHVYVQVQRGEVGGLQWRPKGIQFATKRPVNGHPVLKTPQDQWPVFRLESREEIEEGIQGQRPVLHRKNPPK
jgi:hypothetical protein